MSPVSGKVLVPAAHRDNCGHEPSPIVKPADLFSIGTADSFALSALSTPIGDHLMSSHKKTPRPSLRNPKKRVLIDETREEEAARLEREIAAHPVTRCEPGEYTPTSRPGWSSKPIIPRSDVVVAERIAKKMRKA